MSLEEQSVSFLRLTVAARRRRARPAMAAAKRLGRLLLVSAPLAATASWLLLSPRFAVHDVAVEGTARVDRGWVESGVREFHGRNLIRLDLSAVESRLVKHEWVRSVEIRKLLPDRLSIAVTEYQPAAVLLIAGLGLEADSAHYLDRDGEIIARADDTSGLEGWLVVREVRAGGPRQPQLRARALELARLLETQEAAWIDRVREVEALAPDGFRVELDGLQFSLFVRAETAAERARLLGRLLPELERRLAPIQAVDLRFSRRILIKPAAPGRGDSHLG